MSRIDCICNRNIKVITTYLMSRIGHYETIFDELPYPREQYRSPDDFFLNEDEWTTFKNFEKIFRRAKEMSEETHFYFNCGASSAGLRSWGRYEYFARIFASPDDGFKRLPFFNKNFNDTKEIEVVGPPSYDRSSGKMHVILKIQYHEDVDVNKDYISDPYRRGMISSIPTVWGLSPALIKQVMNPYDPVVFFNEEPEFACFHLAPKLEQGILSIKDPNDRKRIVVGKKIRIESEAVNGKIVFMGKYSEDMYDTGKDKEDEFAILITDTVRLGKRVVLKSGEIFNAPYFILDIKYEKLTLFNRFSPVLKNRRNNKDSGKELSETIDRLRETMEARNEAYNALKIANEELKEAKLVLEDYSRNLEQMVTERTSELEKAKNDLTEFNRDLEKKVKEQVQEINRYNDLRRYLSPKLTERILSNSDVLGNDPQRKLMTVVFTDIRGFSTFTDSVEPEELFHLLDRYLSEMTKIIHRYDGTLNKIIGDGLLIFFNDPIPLKDHAKRAVLMSIDMQKEVADQRYEWLRYGKELGVGIGINTGYMTVGNIGSDTHMDYTVIGNQVNIAARLESYAKAGQILISQRTYSHVMDLVEKEDIGDINVKGIHNPVTTYNVKVI